MRCILHYSSSLRHRTECLNFVRKRYPLRKLSPNCFAGASTQTVTSTAHGTPFRQLSTEHATRAVHPPPLSAGRPPPHTTTTTMATPAPKSTPGNMASFNILHGFTEALVRGMRSSFLTDADYHHLTQCETLDDVRLNLSETDYANALEDMNSLIPTGLQKAAVEKVRFCSCWLLCSRWCIVLCPWEIRGCLWYLLPVLTVREDNGGSSWLIFNCQIVNYFLVHISCAEEQYVA